MLNYGKPKKPKPRTRPWAYIVFLAIGLSMIFSSCTMYAVAKKEIVPAGKQILVSAGPHLIEAAIYDVFSLLGIPFSLSEDLAESLGVVEAEKPATVPAQ